MTNIATRTQFIQNMAKGLGFLTMTATPAGLTTTANNAVNSGFITFQLNGNVIGSTLPGTLASFPLPPVTTSQQLMTSVFSLSSNIGSASSVSLARFYKMGTLVLTSTGDQFTHDAATFPIKKTVFGVASTPIDLIPVFQLTTATSTTAPAFTVKTNAGGNGYTNQDGNGVVGNNLITLPLAATATGTCYMLRLNSGDSAVRDVTQIAVGTASSTGAATIWGMDLLTTLMVGNTETFTADNLLSGLTMADVAPGVATSGTATSFLGLTCFRATNDTYSVILGGALNV